MDRFYIQRAAEVSGAAPAAAAPCSCWRRKGFLVGRPAIEPWTRFSES